MGLVGSCSWPLLAVPLVASLCLMSSFHSCLSTQTPTLAVAFAPGCRGRDELRSRNPASGLRSLINCWAVESINADRDIRRWVRFRPFKLPSARLRGVPLSPEKAGEVSAAVVPFPERSVAGEFSSLRAVFFSVAKCTHRFWRYNVSTALTARYVGASRTLRERHVSHALASRRRLGPSPDNCETNV